MRLLRKITRLLTRISQLLHTPTIVELNLWSPDTPGGKHVYNLAEKMYQKNINF